MARFTTENLPRPVITPELDYEAIKDLRLDDFIAALLAKGVVYDVDEMEFDTGVVAAESAAEGDMHYVSRLNDMARVVLLPSFAEGTDLELHALRAGIVSRLPGEGDPALRERIRLAWKGKSAAGPDDYYKSAARNYDQRVRDVAITSETRDFSSRVLIASILTTDNGGLLDDDLRDELTVVLNDPSFRSRNVTVEVVPAVIKTKNVIANVYLYPETADAVMALAEAKLIAAVAADQQLGFDLTRSYVEKQLHLSGVQRVELQGWTNAYAEPNEAIRLGTIELTKIRLAS